MTILSARELTVWAYSRVLLFRVNLDLPASGITALMGPCAAGKSTLLRALSYQLQHLSTFRVVGEIHYRGVPIESCTAPRMVGQQLQQPQLSVFEQLLTNLPERGQLMRAEQRDRIAEHLSAMSCAHLIPHLDTPLMDLSLADARMAAIGRELVSAPGLLFIDEPCTGLDEHEAKRMTGLLRHIAQDRPIFWVTHHHGRAREVADHVILQAAGQVLEVAPTTTFFTAPSHRCSQTFIRSGGCDLPSPNAAPEEVDESWYDHQLLVHTTLRAMMDVHQAPDIISAPAPEHSVGSTRVHLGAHGLVAADACGGGSLQPAEMPPVTPRNLPPLSRTGRQSPLSTHTQPVLSVPEEDPCLSSGPVGFHWLVTGELAGCPRPGIVDDLDRDLDRIRRTGVTVLVTLTEREMPVAPLRRAGLRNIHFPVVDMKVPLTESALELVRLVERLLSAGHVVAYHCKAGLGRTGTMLVMHLIGRGMTAEEALAFARARNGMWVQSDEQFEFLKSLRPGFLSTGGMSLTP